MKILASALALTCFAAALVAPAGAHADSTASLLGSIGRVDNFSAAPALFMTTPSPLNPDPLGGQINGFTALTFGGAGRTADQTALDTLTLNQAHSRPINGAAAKYFLVIQHDGETVNFDFRYVSNDATGDLAFVVIDQTIRLLASAGGRTMVHPVFTDPNFLPTVSLNDWSFQDLLLQTFQSQPLSAGPHLMTVGVINTVDPTYATGLFLSNLRFTGGMDAALLAPEPSSFVLLGLGLMCLGLKKIRQQPGQ